MFVIMRSFVVLEITATVEDSDNFKHRKRRNDNVRGYVHAHAYNKEVLTRTYRHIDEIGAINDKELIHCKIILQSNDHCKKQRYHNDVDKHLGSMEKLKQPNAAMKISGVVRAPLLVCNVQIVAISNIQRELMIDELHLRGFIVGKKELITKMKSMLVENDHPNTKCETKKKCLFPKLLTASDCSKDVVGITLLKTSEMRSKRK